MVRSIIMYECAEHTMEQGLVEKNKKCGMWYLERTQKITVERLTSILWYILHISARVIKSPTALYYSE